MLRAAFASALVLAALASAPARASGGEKEGDAQRIVEVSTIGTPVIWRGRLVNYVFVQSRLKIGPGQDAARLKAQEPFFRDAVVRAAHRTPFTDPRDLTRIDDRAFSAVLLREAQRIAGPRAFVSAEVTSQQPRQRSGLPDTGASRPQGRAITP